MKKRALIEHVRDLQRQIHEHAEQNDTTIEGVDKCLEQFGFELAESNAKVQRHLEGSRKLVADCMQVNIVVQAAATMLGAAAFSPPSDDQRLVDRAVRLARMLVAASQTPTTETT